MVVTADPSDKLVFSQQQMIDWGGIYTARLQEGQWWRLVTAMFVHASPDHIAFNMLALFQLGRYLEPRYAPARFLGLYFVCGTASSAASAAWYWNDDIVQIGASGAIMAVLGGGVVSAWRVGDRGRSFRNSLAIWAVVVLVNGVLYSANNVAHVVGLATGALAVGIFGRRGRAALAPREAGGPPLDDAIGNPCPRCEAANPPGSRFCGKCGLALEVTAPAP